MGRSRRSRQVRRGQRGAPEELDITRIRAGEPRVESADGAEWLVRPVTAEAAVKDYHCPGCSGVIASGTAHLVVWRHDWMLGEADAIASRRHWHKACWQKRSFRR
ncbi:hypothetical protein ODZ83_00710 [Acaricomes phytoseiuli]|uniref:hypothetical protein n=1 Tax=Acaricomes phytoseiuli TaxID=291968 RepID=UPI000370B84F|nr:hypothetical protein [Acaricomes phytoseiuli]MCW1248734.1 hypothetical protein [Acaricomes phytoseiuli]